MKKSQKQWKNNSFQKSPFEEALLIAMKSVRQFGNQPTEKAKQLKKEGVLVNPNVALSSLGSGFFPSSTFWISTILHFLLFIQFLSSFFLVMWIRQVPLPSTGRSLQILSHLCSSTKRTTTPPDKDLSLLSLGCYWNVKLGSFHDPEKCPFS